MRSRSDLIVAKYLWDALNETKRKALERAAKLVNKAKGLAPEYFEVHRVEAWVAVNARNYAAARSAYEAALDLEPQSAPLHFWYAGFMLRHLNEIEGALLHFKEALKLDSASHQVELEIARCHLYLKQFDEASTILERVKGQADLPAWICRKMHDLSLQVFYWRADHLLSQKDNFGALHCLEQLKAAYEAIPTTQVDDLTREKLAETVQTAQSCERFLNDAAAKGRARALAEWLGRAAAGPAAFRAPELPAPVNSYRGVVDHLPPDKQFGFVRTDDGHRLFFHRNSLIYPEEWRLLREGLPVAFGVGSNHQGPCVVDMTIERPSSLGERGQSK